MVLSGASPLVSQHDRSHPEWVPSGDRLRYVVDDSEVAKLVFEGISALVDLTGELAAGLVIDSVANLVDALLDLIAVLAGLILDVVLVVADGVLGLIEESHVISFREFPPLGDDSVKATQGLVHFCEFFRFTRCCEDVVTVRKDNYVSLPVICFIGPTASGKSRLAVRVCRRLNADEHPAEIINTDSMVVYRGMDIGTATPTLCEQRTVVHHLVSILDVTEPSSVVLMQTLARDAVEDCLSRGAIPILVGGSALYTKAIIDEMSIPPTDSEVRARWQERLDAEGSQALHDELARRDPKAAKLILPGNGRRIVRALEVIDLTGSFTATIPDGTFHWPHTVQIGLKLPREDIDRRIADRVDQMWADGFVDEVRSLVDVGLREGLTASRALGYRQVLEYLDGDYDEDEARRRTVIGTRRFARKQLMWYRRDDRIEWFNALAPNLDDQVVTRVLTSLSLDEED